MILDAETLELTERDRIAARGRAARRPARSSRSSWSRCSRSRPSPVQEHARGGRPAARPARRGARRRPAHAGSTIGSAGTHPFAMWEDQRIVARPRYRDLDQSSLRFVARQELIFGHARPRRHRRPRQGDPRRQRDARPPRRCCSPSARTRRSGAPTRPACAPTRTPIFRAVPARRHPARLATSWDDYEREIEFMVAQRRDGGLHVPLVRRAARTRASGPSRSACATARPGSSTRSASPR